METLLPIIVQVVTGIIGGQAVGAALKQAAMGQLAKVLSGAIGGVAGGAAALIRRRSPRLRRGWGLRSISITSWAVSAAARS